MKPARMSRSRRPAAAATAHRIPAHPLAGPTPPRRPTRPSAGCVRGRRRRRKATVSKLRPLDPRPRDQEPRARPPESASGDQRSRRPPSPSTPPVRVKPAARTGTRTVQQVGDALYPLPGEDEACPLTSCRHSEMRCASLACTVSCLHPRKTRTSPQLQPLPTRVRCAVGLTFSSLFTARGTNGNAGSTAARRRRGPARPRPPSIHGVIDGVHIPHPTIGADDPVLRIQAVGGNVARIVLVAPGLRHQTARGT